MASELVTYEIGESVLVRADDGRQSAAKVWDDMDGESVKVIGLDWTREVVAVPRDRITRLVLNWQDRALRAERHLYAIHRVRHRAGECSFCRAYLDGKLSEGY